MHQFIRPLHRLAGHQYTWAKWLQRLTRRWKVLLSHRRRNPQHCLLAKRGTMSVAMGGYGGHAALCLGGAMRLGDSNTQLFGSMGATKSHAGGAVGLRLSWQSVDTINVLTAS